MFESFLFQALLYILCFVFVWVGAGLIVSTISNVSKFWKIPTFIVSFFLLGILTSLPEISVSTVAILNDDPVIIVGNLLGGIIVLFLGIIPLLGIFGNGVKVPSHLDKKRLFLILLVVLFPSLVTMDNQIDMKDSLLLIAVYLSLFVSFFVRKTVPEKIKSPSKAKGKVRIAILLKIVVGVVLLVLASNQIVSTTIYFATLFNVSSFFVSLIVVAFGTNIPEISIIFRSVLARKKEVAFADYLGSASANTLLLGFFTLIHGKTISIPNHFMHRFSFLIIGLILFFIFARSKNFLSRKESFFLLILYAAFIVFELLLVR